jgi:hypothetical protein
MLMLGKICKRENGILWVQYDYKKARTGIMMFSHPLHRIFSLHCSILEEDVIWSEEAYHSLSQTYKQIPGMKNLMEQMLATTELCNESLEVTRLLD